MRGYDSRIVDSSKVRAAETSGPLPILTVAPHMVVVFSASRGCHLVASVDVQMHRTIDVQYSLRSE